MCPATPPTDRPPCCAAPRASCPPACWLPLGCWWGCRVSGGRACAAAAWPGGQASRCCARHPCTSPDLASASARHLAAHGLCPRRQWRAPDLLRGRQRRCAHCSPGLHCCSPVPACVRHTCTPARGPAGPTVCSTAAPLRDWAALASWLAGAWLGGVRRGGWSAGRQRPAARPREQRHALERHAPASATPQLPLQPAPPVLVLSLCSRPCSPALEPVGLPRSRHNFVLPPVGGWGGWGWVPAVPVACRLPARLPPRSSPGPALRPRRGGAPPAATLRAGAWVRRPAPHRCVHAGPDRRQPRPRRLVSADPGPSRSGRHRAAHRPRALPRRASPARPPAARRVALPRVPPPPTPHPPCPGAHVCPSHALPLLSREALRCAGLAWGPPASPPPSPRAQAVVPVQPACPPASSDRGLQQEPGAPVFCLPAPAALQCKPAGPRACAAAMRFTHARCAVQRAGRASMVRERGCKRGRPAACATSGTDRGRPPAPHPGCRRLTPRWPWPPRCAP